MSEKVTILDVARAAEVSPSTVSNLLNGRAERMRPSTQDRIQQAITKLGYRPNLTARGLKKGSAPLIGLIVPSVYNVLLGNSGRDPVREQNYAEELWGYGVRGLILGSALPDFDHFAALCEMGLHLVAFERPTQQTDRYTIDSIGIDNVEGAYLAVKHLTDLGHRRIGFVSGAIQTVSRRDRLEGYRRALSEADIAFDESLIWQGKSDIDFGDAETMNMGQRGAAALLAQPNPPTALFTINDMIAFGSYAAARDLGIRVPDDLSIVGFDDIALTEIVDPPLTTVKQPIEEIARCAVERLLGRLQDDLTEPLGHTALSPKLIVRSSTAVRK